MDVDCLDDLHASVQLLEGCKTSFSPSDHTVAFTEGPRVPFHLSARTQKYKGDCFI